MPKREKRVAILVVFALALYLWPPRPADILPRMDEILSSLEELYQGETIRIMPSYTEPDGMDVEKIDEIRSKMNAAGLDGVSLSCSEGGCLSVYKIDRVLGFLRPSLYYKFDSDGRVEENIVEDIEVAIKKDNHEEYSFCRKTEKDNWLYCENNH